ncbi:UDP-galactopyranose mutase [Aureimonas pseudogalii]|uniref:UDP-galactopyranose mutase n=2 Tax=Aureimonas pseudogalii TaxID=1744844 RepID=A0A7W6H6F6_9HYPH|nr:UDP-galactopyranose mutase [Aureimonas pseudogalii]
MPTPNPIICFSHLRWDFVTQRPQHLMRRFARERTVFVFEEFIPCDHPLPYLEYHPFPADGVIALRPRLPHWWGVEERETALRGLLDMLVETGCRSQPVLWFYTPMMFAFADGVEAAAVVYDCMDELTGFRFADPRLVECETALLARADAVFTGGWSLYEAKRHRHSNIHAFPSAVDADHFGRARDRDLPAPADQAGLSGPILGFYGVIDERLDLALIREVAALRPDWTIVMLGPVAKLDPAELPRAPNLHWLGNKRYDELPAYLAGWNVALMPFAINEATRFISPTKTPEYLAAGRPVVSTGIADVIRHYGDLEGCAIASDAAGFVAACEAALALSPDGAWRDAADRTLAEISWDRTQARMAAIVGDAVTAAKITRAHAANDATRVPTRVPARRERFDTLVVGAGFAGAVLAERLAADAGQRVLVVDRRDHIAGNAYDHHDAAGVLVHRYGPHIFHTNSQMVVDYLSRFTAWRPYEHRVLARVGDQLLPVPINRTTLNELYGLGLSTDAEAEAFLAARAEPVAEIRTSEDVVVSSVGRELYETFFRGYTRKQWGLDPSELDRSVTARVPTRTDTDDRYFLDRFQAMPAGGYTAMFARMLDHPNITVRTGVDYRDVRERVEVGHTVFTGPVDEFFDHRFGKLPYRCLDFRHETHERETFQPVAVVNYPGEDVAFTRITEYKHLTGQSHPKTSVSYEFPSDQGDPYYPVPRDENQALYRRYEALARATPDVSFVGRLATYRYYNMDQVVAQALATYRRMCERAPMAGAVPVSSSVPAGPST